MYLTLHSIYEEQPGPKWQALFEEAWPAYKPWFLSEGVVARPGYLTSRRQLRTHMPELLPIYEQLVELAGGGDLAARFLSLYCPPPYLVGCSQVAWTRTRPVLLRNYDYSPKLFEGNLLYSCWNQGVIAMLDCLWGVLDGINERGLAVSLTFGGRKITGEGFGIPLILRYVLEFCETTAEATAVLLRVPVHMPYNVTVLDAAGRFATLYLSPVEPPVVAETAVNTNHQKKIDWPDYARLTSTMERKQFLEERLVDSTETCQRLLRRFLHAPLHQTEYEKAFGTLYTAAYYPAARRAAYHWPKHSPVEQSFQHFQEQKTTINLKLARGSFKTHTIS